MCSLDSIDRIDAQNRTARRAIAEAQDIIAKTIEALERATGAAGSDIVARQADDKFDPRFSAPNILAALSLPDGSGSDQG